ncbi:hypothetical protein SKAU_G00025410 [Synaphobranchus kaupii]|uniref:Uncharacterized protein n=1 Tax=Synaphobranchus kaupii TaxID=118154 RepID=A0A9Q1JDJ4_SYNKA|nr:hypothetical protein SKAU_G00025410 [Synaphobranchus kaupii]
MIDWTSDRNWGVFQRRVFLQTSTAKPHVNRQAPWGLSVDLEVASCARSHFRPRARTFSLLPEIFFYFPILFAERSK